MRRPVGLLAAAVLAVSGVASCGIPDETPVRVLGSGPPPGLGDGGDTATKPPKRGDTRDREMFVKNYLAAAAGNPADSVKKVQEFLEPASRSTFKPEPEINVVRLLDDPLVNAGNEVTLQVQHVGVLRANGALEPPTAQEATYKLVVNEAEDAGQGFYVASPPPLLLMSDEALANFYRPQSIYFWNNDHTFLVPDLRYLPGEVSREKTPTQILQWLTGGPSLWLGDAVAKLPDGTGPTGNVVPDASAGKLEIGLSAPAVPTKDEPALERLGRQLMWSLRPKELVLKVAGQPDASFTGDDFLASNPSYQLDDVPQRFCVYQGRVSRVAVPGGPTGAVPLLTPEVNHDVRTAGLSRSGSTTYAALVVADGAGQRLVVGAGRDGQQASFVSSQLPPGAVSRPVWLTALSGGEPERGIGLIAAAGKLYRFSSSDGAPRPVVPSGVAGAVTAVAAAPDGFRIAYVAGGNLYVTAVTSAGTEVRASRQVRTSLQKITGVDWSGENSLVVAGEQPVYHGLRSQVAIVDVTVDGGLETVRLRELGNDPVSHLAAYPAKPGGMSGAAATPQGAAVTYVAKGVAYELLSPPEPIQESEVVGAGPPDNAPNHPAAPFFLR